MNSKGETTSASHSLTVAGSPPLPTRPQSAESALPQAAEKAAQLPPLAGHPWLVNLFDKARIHDVATLPLGTTEPRPIVVAVHGAGDRPDWACGGWRIAVQSYAFVVCPEGLPMGGARFGWGSTRDIAAAVDRALAAMHRKFPEYIHSGPMIYAGFSQGATLAAPFLIENAVRFPIVALAEGGYNYITDFGFSQRFRAAGGKRILLLCGTASCLVTAKRAQTMMRRAGLEAIVTGDATAGHNLNATMQNALQSEWHQLVAGIEGWETYEPNRWKR